MTRSKLEKLITDFVIQHDLDASFVQQTEGLTYVRFVVEEDFQEMTKPKEAWEKSEYTEYYDLMKKAKQF